MIELMCLGKLINETEIPKGHNEIITAWVERQTELFRLLFQEGGRDLDVPGNLIEQKHEAEKKEEEKKTKEEVETATL